MARTGPPNLQAVIRAKALASNVPTDADLQAMIIALVYSMPDDVAHHAMRAKVKLDAIMALHKINQDNKPPPDTTGGDQVEDQVLQMLMERRKKS